MTFTLCGIGHNNFSVVAMAFQTGGVTMYKCHRNRRVYSDHMAWQTTMGRTDETDQTRGTDWTCKTLTGKTYKTGRSDRAHRCTYVTRGDGRRLIGRRRTTHARLRQARLARMRRTIRLTTTRQTQRQTRRRSNNLTKTRRAETTHRCIYGSGETETDRLSV